MDALIFLAVIACCAVVLVWYVANAAAGSSGERGWLAVAAPDAAPAQRYRMQARARERMKPAHGTRRMNASAPAYAEKSGRKHAYRHAGAPGYRQRGDAARYKARASLNTSNYPYTL